MSNPHIIQDERLVLLENLLTALKSQGDGITRFCNLHSEYFKQDGYDRKGRLYDEAKRLAAEIRKVVQER